MSGIFDFIQAAVPGAVAARGGYLAGQTEEEDKQRAQTRQSLLDRISAAREGAYANEANARADALRNPQELDTPVFDQSGGAYTYNRRKGTLRRTPVEGDDASSAPSQSQSILDRLGATNTAVDASSDPSTGSGGLFGRITPKAAAAPSASSPTAPPKFGTRAPIVRPATVKDANTVNLQSKKIEDVYTDGTRKVIRDATPAELEKAQRIPGQPADGGAGSATNQRRLVLQTRLGNLKTQIDQTQKDAENQNLADDYDTPAAKTRIAALRTRGDSLRTVADQVNSELEQLDKDTPGPKGAGGGRGGGGKPDMSQLSITQDQFDYLTTPTEQGGQGLKPADVLARYKKKP